MDQTTLHVPYAVFALTAMVESYADVMSGSQHVRVLLNCLEFLTWELLISLCELL